MPSSTNFTGLDNLVDEKLIAFKKVIKERLWPIYLYSTGLRIQN